ncbi:MAG TPA: two-component regulator propeller domain-containing protein, partial [Vicinamibacterales bacterium]|nr:two-component regulator propeller domain-containing protein [Vicinamibacterales bacterium]
TDAGLVRFDPTGSPRLFTPITSEDQDRRARTINVLREDADGVIWIGSRKGLSRVVHRPDGDALETVDIGLPADFPDRRDVSAIVEDHERSLWITTSFGLYRRSRDGSVKAYHVADGLPTERLSDLLLDHRGRLWIGSYDGGLYRAQTETGRVTFEYPLYVQNGLPSEWIQRLIETADHRIWLATGRGLVEFFPDRVTGPLVKVYTKANGLSDANVRAFAEDLAGNLWVGLGATGAMKLARGGFTTYAEADGVESASAIFEDSAGTLCVKGHGPGPVLTATAQKEFGCLAAGRVAWFRPRPPVGWGWVTESVTLRDRHGDWWLGSSAGVFRFPAMPRFASIAQTMATAQFTERDGLAAGQVYRLFEDSRDGIWISTYGETLRGLARWDRTTGRLEDFSHRRELPLPKEDLAKAIGEDSAGRIWIGFNGGLARYVDGAFTFYATQDGLPAGAILAMHVDRSKRLWLASEHSGLIRVDADRPDSPSFVAYTTAEGLSSNNINVLAEDRDGFLYLAGGAGIDRFDPSSGRVKHFSVADGLPDSLVTAGYLDRSGTLWFGTSNSLVRLSPEADRQPTAPPVFISGLRLGGVPSPLSAVGETALTLGDLSPPRNEIELDFLGLAFGSGDVLRYQYRLDGADADWTTPVDRRTVTYANLGAGHYVFHVRAINSDGLMSATPATVTFTVLRPVWQRWWFVSAAALLVAVLVHTLYQARADRLLAIAHMRARIATDLHDDIGANLTRIALISEVAAAGGGSGPLASIASIARESVSSMSDIVWAINPKREDLRDLVRRMRRHAEEVCATRDIALEFVAPADADNLRLGMDVRRDVLLIFKEAVSNAVRHSHCTKLAVTLRPESSGLVLVIADNGGGFDATIAHEGQGLAGIQRRARRLKAHCTIESGPTGTIVAVVVPT